MNDQSAKADGGKLRLTLVPTEAVEAVAAIRMYGVQKYVDEENWKRVEKDRYKDAALRHFIKYTREPYGMDDESNLPHLWHCLCNLFFLCSLEIQDGTLPQPQDALKKMRHPDPVTASTSHGTGEGGYIYLDDIERPVMAIKDVTVYVGKENGEKRRCMTCKHAPLSSWQTPCNVCNGDKWEKKDE